MSHKRAKAERRAGRQPPRITMSRVLQQWQQANQLSWEERSSHCAVSGAAFMTGDVTLIFGGDGHPVHGDYMLPQHAIAHMEETGEKPKGAGLFIQKEHRNVDFADLEDVVQERVAEGMALLDMLFSNVEAAYAAQQRGEEWKAPKPEDAN